MDPPCLLGGNISAHAFMTYSLGSRYIITTILPEKFGKKDFIYHIRKRRRAALAKEKKELSNYTS